MSFLFQPDECSIWCWSSVLRFSEYAISEVAAVESAPALVKFTPSRFENLKSSVSKMCHLSTVLMIRHGMFVVPRCLWWMFGHCHLKQFTTIVHRLSRYERRNTKCIYFGLNIFGRVRYPSIHNHFPHHCEVKVLLFIFSTRVSCTVIYVLWQPCEDNKWKKK